MNLLIIGAPGAGKGTVSESIISNYDIAHISTGDMLRAAIKDKTALGLQAKEYMDAGNLVPDDIIHDIIVDRLSRDDTTGGFLFDGYPRTLNQAIDLSEILKQLNKRIDCVINLDIADEDLIKRITGRRLCPQCGEIYNIYYSASKIAGKCDECGSDLITRQDDNQESLKVRLEEYHKNTQPLIEYYSKMDLVRTVCASNSKEDVYREVESILKGLK